MKRLLFTLALLLPALYNNAQVAPDKYFVEFTDKNNSPYSVERPWEFLTQRSIDRRLDQSIVITNDDIPVNSDYIEALTEIGVTPLVRSKWFNGAIIQTSNTALIDSIENLPFVSKVLKNSTSGVQPNSVDKFSSELESVVAVPSSQQIFTKSTNFDYGDSYTQIHMLNGDLLHNLGYRGEGKVIAVLDAGFIGADTIPAFDSLWLGGQILGTRDFVSPGPNVFHTHPHGTMVLSVMAGNIPGKLIGTAPEAGYWLLRSEDTGSEYLVEEYNWVCAAEFADSVGADIINSSLGYTVFWDTLQNHTCDDMDGNTTPATRGANMAAARGIMVVNSAGNSGGSSWLCVGAPSDGVDVVAVGAVDSLGNYASFSSLGIVTETRVKPNVAAMGYKTVLSFSDGNIVQASGTSFSSPVIAGMMACAWQAMPQLDRSQLQSQVEQSSSQFTEPDSLLGFGIPDFYKMLPITEHPLSRSSISVFPNPFHGRLTISTGGSGTIPSKITILTIEGRVVQSFDNISGDWNLNSIYLDGLDHLSTGLYLLKIEWPGSSSVPNYFKIQKQSW